MEEKIVKKNVKNMYLRISEDGTVIVTAPESASDEKIRQFIDSKSKWIEIHRENVLKKQDTLPEYVLNPDDPELKEQAKEELAKRLSIRVPMMEERTGLKCSGWTIRDVKTYWGFCNLRTMELSFNLRLVNRSDKELDYVILHELCHTVIPRHKKNFWDLVGQYMPDYREVKEGLD